MNPEIINDERAVKRRRAGGGRAFHSRLESFVGFIREQRQQRKTWQEIATLLHTEKGCPITFQGLHQFYRRYLKRQGRPHWESESMTLQSAMNSSAPAPAQEITTPTNRHKFNTDI